MSAAGDTPEISTIPTATPPAGETLGAKTPALEAQPLELGGHTLLSPRQMRKLRAHEEEFVQSLSGRLSLFLRAEVVMKLKEIQIISYKKVVGTWTNPCHISLFKTEPLRGVSILHLPSTLGLSIVDRMMGGAGKPLTMEGQEMSEIEKALLDQLVQIFLEEWCGNWAKAKELKPLLLGSETNGAYLQTAPPQTDMLILTVPVSVGELKEKIQLVFPYASLEPLIRQICGDIESATPAPTIPAQNAAIKWNPCLDDVRLPLTAEWQGLELAARDILNLKVGDVLQIDPERAGQVVVRLAELPKFQGHLGTLAGKWAVELTKHVKR